jgi:hypothetical protein
MKKLQYSASLAVAGWWAAQRARLGVLPGRKHFDPVEFAPVLTHIVLVDVLDGLRFRMRLCGSDVADLVPANRSGDILEAANIGARWPYVEDCYRRMLTTRAALASCETLTSAKGLQRRVEIVRVPLAEDGLNVDMILAAVTRIESPAQAGRSDADAPVMVAWTQLTGDTVALRGETAAGPGDGLIARLGGRLFPA